MICLLTFDVSQGFSINDIVEFTRLYWAYKEMNFHIFMAQA